jgi:hypothetical protein
VWHPGRPRARDYGDAMSTVTRPRGPLPPRVYWTRRLLLVVVALALVFGIGRLLGSGGSGSPTARQVGATATTSTAQATVPAPTPDAGPTRKAGAGGAARTGKNATPTPTPLAAPTGDCADSDVVVSPSVKGTAYAGHHVVLTMTLTTRVSEACTWEVSPDRLAVKITSGEDRIWSSQDCPGAVPKQEVVVRRLQPTTVTVGWNGQRSDRGCTRSTDWAEAGYYHVLAAAFGADPVDLQFELAPPVPRTITATPTPTETASGTASAEASPSGKPAAKPTETSSPGR